MSDSQEQGAAGNKPSDKAEVLKKKFKRSFLFVISNQYVLYYTDENTIKIIHSSDHSFLEAY